MTDASVGAALRSPAPLVVVQAPAGCGKTYQGAQYALDAASTPNSGRILVLTHTHAASDVFAARTTAARARVEIRTIDSLITEMASAYHRALKLPADAGAWARTVDDGYDILASRVASLLDRAPAIAKTLAHRYQTVICDEHQDACAARNAVVLALHRGGARLRVFGDPMQRIFGGRSAAAFADDRARWDDLARAADAFEDLDHPHRWKDTNPNLGAWILRARGALEAGQPIDLTGRLPNGVRVLTAENTSANARRYILNGAEAGPIRKHVCDAPSCLVVTRRNDTVDSLRAFFGRLYPIWEGHTRDAFAQLVAKIRTHKGAPRELGDAAVSFIDAVAVGFTASFSRPFLDEIETGCVRQRRGTPEKLQELARLILDEPDHRGVSRMLRHLGDLISSVAPFSDVKIDYRREFQDALRLEHYDDPDDCFEEQARRRTFSRPMPPRKSISTIHKAKGLEFSDVLVMPCDRQHFGETMNARCLLYVAISRAMRSLTFVVSRRNPSPLLRL